MPQRIYLLGEGQTLRSLVETDYLNEDELQKLIAENPQLIDGDLVDHESPRRWLLIRREMPVTNDDSGGRWSLDHLLLDQDGIPTLVEVKRATDTRARREVVAQMLDYAANAVQFWPVDSLRTLHADRLGQLTEADAAVRQILGSNGDIDHYWQQVKTNLYAGKIRMIFLADSISPELRRIIEFLNKQMDPAEVLGLEIRQFADGNTKTLVPHVIGHTSEAEQRKGVSSRGGRKWDEESFMARMRELNGAAVVAVAEGLLRWSKTHASGTWWGEGKENGSFVPVIIHSGKQHQAFAVYTYRTPDAAVVEVYFYWYTYKPPFDDEALRIEMLEKLNTIPGVSLPNNSINRRPSIRLTTLAQGNALDQFLEVMNWYIKQIKTRT